MNVLCLFSLAFFTGFKISVSSTGQDLVVKTQYGPVRGTVKHATGTNRPVYSFFGIPYARTPDYTFRFRPPVDPWNWTEVKNATDEQVPICYQDREYLKSIQDSAVFQFYIDGNHPMSEDCLNVNVFSPRLPSSGSKPLPVIVWIHGGSLQVTASTQKLWMMPAFEDVVLVAVQYRVGAFGFMSFDDHWAPPNAGIFDQVKALKWIQKNIRNFGGDRNSVTLYGASAGGVSATGHAVSPESKDLFHRVVATSGVYTMPLVWGVDHEKKAMQIAENLDCHLRETCFTATCIRNKRSSSEIIRAARKAKALFFLQEDGKFFPGPPKTLISNWNPSVPLLLGVTAGEMDFYILRKIIPSEELIGPKLTRTNAIEIFRNILSSYYPNLTRLQENSNEFVSLYLKNYTDWRLLLNGLSEFSADALFYYPAKEVAQETKDNGANVYFYQFSKKPRYYDSTNKITRTYEVKRPDHSEDQGFLLGYPFLPEIYGRGMTFTEDEVLLSRKLMHTLASFAKTGKPVFEGSLKWPEYPSYLDINTTTSVQSDFRAKYLDVWKRLLDSSENEGNKSNL